MPKDSIFALNHIMYGIFMIILLNIAGILTVLIDIMPRQVIWAVSIGFPICLVLFAFFHGFKNNIGFKSYIVITLFLSLLLGFLQLWEPLGFLIVASSVPLRNLAKYVLNEGALSDYYYNNMSTNIKSGLIVNIVYLGIMFLSYQGGYIVSKTLKGKHKAT